jgi:hypothetical protein
VAHACDPTTQEAEIRRTEVQSQPWQIICETLSQKYPTQKNRSGGVAQGVFKPQYCQRERERERENRSSVWPIIQFSRKTSCGCGLRQMNIPGLKSWMTPATSDAKESELFYHVSSFWDIFEITRAISPANISFLVWAQVAKPCSNSPVLVCGFSHMGGTPGLQTKISRQEARKPASNQVLQFNWWY